MIARLRQYLITGLLVWLPMGITAWVLLWLVGILDGIFVAILKAAQIAVPQWHTWATPLGKIPGLGVILVLVVLLATGLFVANIFGQWWLKKWDSLMVKIPVVRSIYSSVKQVSDTLFAGSGPAFSKAVLIEYPRRDIWTIAFLTGKPSGEVAEKLGAGDGNEFISVYVPTTPNPTSGFFLMIAKSDIKELNMSVDEALKYVISMGVVSPATSASKAALPLIQKQTH